MWTENEIFREDLERLAETKSIPWDAFIGKRILVTGATGLIGYTVTSALLYYGKTRKAGIRVAALVRNIQQAWEKFSSQLAEGLELELFQGSVEIPPKIPGEVDYIIHGASPTASVYFVEKPVETIAAVVMGTRNMLELAREKQVLGFAYLSSMEVYGEVADKTSCKEENLGYIDLYSLRSSYPASKRLAENLCCAYAGEYGIPATAVRLAQTFGPGVDWEDGRVFAYAVRCALTGEDIRLKTSGAKENMYLYTADAASAILLLLVKGARGTAYNAGNPETYCSVKEMAEFVATEIGKGKIAVVTNSWELGGSLSTGELPESGCDKAERTEVGARVFSSADVLPNENGVLTEREQSREAWEKLYRPEGFLNLDISKIKRLGWAGTVDLPEMFRRMAATGFEKWGLGKEHE